MPLEFNYQPVPRKECSASELFSLFGLARDAWPEFPGDVTHPRVRTSSLSPIIAPRAIVDHAPL